MGALAAPAFKDLTTMTIEEKTKAYKIKVNKLIKEIEEILNSHLSKSKQSDKITARLREEYIFAKNSYIKKFNNTSLVTIDPYSEDVKPKLEEGDIEGTEDDKYSKIHANSFGPFNPVEYFKDGNFRILWILKEPYVKNGEYEALKCGRRKYLGGNDQGKQYYDEGWSVIKLPAKDGGNPTIANLIRISKVILNELGEPFNGNDEEAVMKEVMKRICIIEVSHFPGLAFQSSNSDDKNIEKWAKLNKDLIQELIAFYDPNVIIGGNTIGHFYTEIPKSKHDFNSLDKYIEGGKALLSNIGLQALKIKQSTESTSYIFDCKDSTGKTIYVVDAYHPCPKQNKEYEYTLDMGKADASLIKNGR